MDLPIMIYICKGRFSKMYCKLIIHISEFLSLSYHKNKNSFNIQSEGKGTLHMT